MSAAADVAVPEPSPLFWDHFSARVREAVAAEGLPRRPLWSWPRLAMPVAAAAMAGVILAVALSTGPETRPDVPAVAPTASTAPVDLLSDPQPPGDDTALTLVAELRRLLQEELARSGA
jgi:hypothetical protein